MKKILLSVAAISIILVLSACGQKPANQDMSAPAAQVEPEKPGIISSIKDAMGMGQKMECTYKMKIGNEVQESKTYVEGKKYKGEMMVNGKNQISIFDGQVIYSWAEGEKTGTKIDMECMKGLETPEPTDQGPAMPDQPNTQPEDFDDALDVKCQAVGSIDFSIPTDVVFTDQCEMMKKALESAKQMQEQMKDIKLPDNMPNIPDMPSIQQ